MVPPLLLLTMLHCKQRKSRKSSIKEKRKAKTTSGGTTELNINVKLEENEFEYDQTMCRICLKQGSIPIYASVDISNDLITFAAVEVSFNDIYPKFLCGNCHLLLQGAILFRKTAQQSDQILRQPREEDKDDLPMRHEDLRNGFMNTNDDNDEINETFDCDEDDTVEEQTDSFYKKKEVKIEKKDQCKYFCKKCDLGFNTLKKYSEHRLSPEHDNPRKICPICNKSYQSVYLKKHLHLHTKDKNYICDICGKKIAFHGQFTRHRITHFLDNLPFQCTLCPYKGRFRESLKLHMRTHTGEKPHQCPHCPSRHFINASNLNKHLLTHRNSHDFYCSQCQRGFYTKRALDIHFKVDHTGIKDHICNVCGKAFGYRKQMMKHQLKVHKREKLRSGRTPLYVLLESKKRLEENNT